MQTKEGRLWYQEKTLSSGDDKEHDKDMTFPIRDLSACPPQNAEDARFTYNMDDIDAITEPLGIRWEKSKNHPFGSVVPYIRFA